MMYRRRERYKAVRWFKEGDHPMVESIPEYMKGYVPVVNGAKGYLESSSIGYFVCPGDYIVHNPDGSVYVYNPELFQHKFEPVADDDLR